MSRCVSLKRVGVVLVGSSGPILILLHCKLDSSTTALRPPSGGRWCRWRRFAGTPRYKSRFEASWGGQQQSGHMEVQSKSQAGADVNQSKSQAGADVKTQLP